MNFNSDDIKTIKILAEMFMANVDDPKQAARLHNLIDKCDACENMRLNHKLTAQKKRRCNDLIKEVSRFSTEYAGYAGDMGMINEYDKMKKEISVLADSIGDVEGQIRAEAEIAKKQLDSIFDAVRTELQDNEIAKNVGDAERRARADIRYTSALEDYKDLLKYAYVMKNAYRNIVDTRDDIRQSISTARNSIIAEGYNN